MRMGLAARDGPGGWQMDGTDGMGRLAMWLRAGILPSIMREPSAVSALPPSSTPAMRACHLWSPPWGAETMLS